MADVLTTPRWPRLPSLPFPERCAGALRTIVLLNPPHTAIGSRIPREHLPPLGLLSVGGPLIDAGFTVHLVDAEFGPLPPDEIVRQVARFAPDAVLLGHSGSSSAHETVLDLCTRLKAALPGIVTVYGGVHPTYHFDEILRDAPQIDLVVRGEGEATTVLAMHALARGKPLHEVRGIAWRQHAPGGGQVQATPAAEMIRDLDAHRIGWELVDLLSSCRRGCRVHGLLRNSRRVRAS